MIELDGATLEGGGQLMRTAVALAAITEKPCRVFNIRKNRLKPGLMPQHLLSIQALARLCDGKLEGDRLGSEEIKFYPGQTYRDRISINIPTAGSITLILQTLIPPALFTRAAAKGEEETLVSSPARAAAKSKRRVSSLPSLSHGESSVGEEETLVSSPAPFPIKIVFDGGATDTFFSPTIDHFRYVFLKILEKIGAKIDINIIRRGYYPEGGARVEVTISLAELNNLNLTERGSLKKILVISGASNSLKEKKAAERQIAGAREILGKLKLPTEERVEYYDTRCPGSQICLIAEFGTTFIGTDNLGKLGKRAEDVGKEAALELLKEQKSGTCLDKHSADQILPYLALIPEKSQVTVSEMTNHCKTNIWIIEKFIEGRFEIKGNLITWFPL